MHTLLCKNLQRMNKYTWNSWVIFVGFWTLSLFLENIYIYLTFFYLRSLKCIRVASQKLGAVRVPRLHFTTASFDTFSVQRIPNNCPLKNGTRRCLRILRTTFLQLPHIFLWRSWEKNGPKIPSPPLKRGARDSPCQSTMTSQRYISKASLLYICIFISLFLDFCYFMDKLSVEGLPTWKYIFYIPTYLLPTYLHMFSGIYYNCIRKLLYRRYNYV